jgi:hypothetical protein
MRESLLCRLAAATAVLVAWHGPAGAQDRDALRTEARTAAQQLRAEGEPKDRCTIGAVQDAGTVVSVFRETPLHVGDQITRLNGVDVSSQSTDRLVAILRNIAPDATVPVTVRRSGEGLDLQVPCSNARQGNEVMLAALDQVGRGRFDDCVQTLAGHRELGLFGANLRLQCASLSRSPERHNLGDLAYDAARSAIDFARWRPDQRRNVATRLRSLQGIISQSRGGAAFQELVSLTRQWPGDEHAFERSEPDWGLFRRNAEVALVGRLVDPESARIDWPYGFTLGTWRPLLVRRIEGYWTCGLINARNRMGGYTGATSFVVVLNSEGQVLYSEIGTAGEIDLLSSQCTRSANLLPLPPPALTNAPVAHASSAPASLADELERLVRLRDSGALSPAEFEAAKARLLAGPR